MYATAIIWWVCQAKSISSVGTKKDVGVEDIRSRNLQRLSATQQAGTERKSVRVITSDRMHEYKLVVLTIEIAGLRPPKIMHLVDEGTLPDDCTDEIDREDAIVGICEANALGSTGVKMT